MGPGDQVHARRHQNHRTRGSAWRNLQGARPEVAGSHHADRSRHPGLPVIPSRGRASSHPGARERRASCRQETRRKVRTQAEAGSAPGARSRPYGSRGGQKPARGRHTNEPRKPTAETRSVAAKKFYLVAELVDLDAEAVELDLVLPVVA